MNGNFVQTLLARGKGHQHARLSRSENMKCSLHQSRPSGRAVLLSAYSCKLCTAIGHSPGPAGRVRSCLGLHRLRAWTLRARRCALFPSGRQGRSGTCICGFYGRCGRRHPRQAPSESSFMPRPQSRHRPGVLGCVLMRSLCSLAVAGYACPSWIRSPRRARRSSSGSSPARTR